MFVGDRGARLKGIGGTFDGDRGTRLKGIGGHV
jgi:hypothetical protein